MKNGTLKSYTIGFILSIGLTLTAYFFVYKHIDSGHYVFAHNTLTAVLIALALIQFYVQAVFFLHLGRDKSVRWNLVSFLFMVGVVSTIVLGSLWIMANLDYHHGQTKTPEETSNYIVEDELPKQQDSKESKSEHYPH